MTWVKNTLPNLNEDDHNESFSDNGHVEVMMKLYGYLRDEILVSIRFQNRVILGEAVVVGLIYAVRLTSPSSRPELLLQLAAMILPPVIIISTALWTVEQTRMMRIGNYLGLLENRINEELNEACLTWENWLRSGNVSYISTIHHTAKMIGYVGFFFVLGVLGLFLYVDQFLADSWSGLFPIFKQGNRLWLQSAILAIYIIAFIIILLMTFPIITYRESFICRHLERIPTGQKWTFELNEEDFPEDETVADGGQNQNKRQSEDGTEENHPDWANKHIKFKKWEYCYKIDVLDCNEEKAVNALRQSYPPDANIREAPGMTSALSGPFSSVRRIVCRK